MMACSSTVEQRAVNAEVAGSSPARPDRVIMSKKFNQIRQQFLLSFFTEAGYIEKQINGFWLIKSMNGDTKQWQVSIYTPESYQRYKDGWVTKQEALF